MNDPPVHTLMDLGVTVQVKPCRKCGTIPIFFYTDGGYEETNIYVIKCPNCGVEKLRLWEPEEVEAAWNDWSCSLEEWESDCE